MTSLVIEYAVCRRFTVIASMKDIHIKTEAQAFNIKVFCKSADKAVMKDAFSYNMDDYSSSSDFFSWGTSRFIEFIAVLPHKNTE